MAHLGSDRGTAWSADAECACQAVELASLLLRAGRQRVEWCLRSSSTTSGSVSSGDEEEDPCFEAWFALLRSRIISTVGKSHQFNVGSIDTEDALLPLT